LNIDSINKWLALSGNFGVIAGIVFLGIEISQNTKSMQAQTRAQLTAQGQNAIELLMTDAELFDIYMRVNRSEEVTPLEQGRYNLYVRHDFRGLENVFYQYRAGNFTDTEFEGQKGRFRSAFIRPGYRRFWTNNKSEFSLEFQNEIESLYSEIATE